MSVLSGKQVLTNIVQKGLVYQALVLQHKVERPPACSGHNVRERMGLIRSAWGTPPACPSALHPGGMTHSRALYAARLRPAGQRAAPPRPSLGPARIDPLARSPLKVVGLGPSLLKSLSG